MSEDQDETEKLMPYLKWAYAAQVRPTVEGAATWNAALEAAAEVVGDLHAYGTPVAPAIRALKEDPR